MDAKGIWIPTTSRTNYSSTHKMNNREKQKKLRQANIKKNLENQKGGKPSGRTRGGGVQSNPANLGGGKKVVEKKKSPSGKTYTKAQLMAQKRIAAKKAGTYKKPKTAKELAKARLKIKKKK
jgi:hypothetical protein